MATPLKKPATFADLESVPEHMIGQILEGELVVMPRPAIPHAHTASNAGADINQRFGRSRPPGGWWIVDEPEVHLHGNALVPDLAGWRRERLPVLPSEAFFTLAPDWVMEILSPSKPSVDRIVKARIYAREGVTWFWLVDPVGCTIEVNRLQEGAWLRIAEFGAGEPVRAEPFEASEFDASDWFIKAP